jgi:hypothetical protein
VVAADAVRERLRHECGRTQTASKRIEVEGPDSSFEEPK